MHYEKLKNGDLLISAITENEQKVIDAIIVAIETYVSTLPHDELEPYAESD